MGFLDKKQKRRVGIASTVYALLILITLFFSWKVGIENLKPIYVVNISIDVAAMLMGFVLFVCCIIDVQKSGNNLKYLFYLINIAYLALFSDSIAWLVDGRANLRWLNMLDNTVYYMCAPIEACFFWLYTVTYLRINTKRVNKLSLLIQIGLVISLLMRVINLFTGIYFWVDNDGIYHRSSNYIYSMFYSLITIIVALGIITYKRKQLERHQIVIFYIYALAPFFVGIFTALFYGFSISSAIVMIVILLMYCVLNVAQGREKAASDRELDLASRIQENVLPRIFPPFPERDEFDLYASMKPAKEVGGDFYDFFMIDDDHLAITIADVSGKGIPGALFMMISKALLKNQTIYTKSHDPGRILSKANEQLCEGNQAELFVTAWLGILTISTGELHFSNAGHEYPAIKRKGEPFKIVKEKHSPPLATLEGLVFKTGVEVLNPGDTLFVYTDGVTEATNKRKELFGLDRMIDALNENSDDELKELDDNLRKRISLFVGAEPQFDDITMLCLRYYGSEGKKA